MNYFFVQKEIFVENKIAHLNVHFTTFAIGKSENEKDI